MVDVEGREAGVISPSDSRPTCTSQPLRAATSASPVASITAAAGTAAGPLLVVVTTWVIWPWRTSAADHARFQQQVDSGGRQLLVQEMGHGEGIQRNAVDERKATSHAADTAGPRRLRYLADPRDEDSTTSVLKIPPTTQSAVLRPAAQPVRDQAGSGHAAKLRLALDQQYSESFAAGGQRRRPEGRRGHHHFIRADHGSSQENSAKPCGPHFRKPGVWLSSRRASGLHRRTGAGETSLLCCGFVGISLLRLTSLALRLLQRLVRQRDRRAPVLSDLGAAARRSEIEPSENGVVGKLTVGTFALAVEQSKWGGSGEPQCRVEARSLVDELVSGPSRPSSARLPAHGHPGTLLGICRPAEQRGCSYRAAPWRSAGSRNRSRSRCIQTRCGPPASKGLARILAPGIDAVLLGVDFVLHRRAAPSAFNRMRPSSNSTMRPSPIPCPMPASPAHSHVLP